MKMIDTEKLIKKLNELVSIADAEFISSEKAFDTSRDDKIRTARGYDMQIANGKLVALGLVLEFVKAKSVDVSQVEKPAKEGE